MRVFQHLQFLHGEKKAFQYTARWSITLRLFCQLSAQLNINVVLVVFHRMNDRGYHPEGAATPWARATKNVKKLQNHM